MRVHLWPGLWRDHLRPHLSINPSQLRPESSYIENANVLPVTYSVLCPALICLWLHNAGDYQGRPDAILLSSHGDVNCPICHAYCSRSLLYKSERLNRDAAVVSSASATSSSASSSPVLKNLRTTTRWCVLLSPSSYCLPVIHSHSLPLSSLSSLL